MNRFIRASTNGDRSKTQHKIYTALTTGVSLEKACEAEVQQGLPNAQNARKSLIRNLGTNFSKHLKKLKGNGTKITNYIENIWITQRDRTISDIEEIIELHKSRNIELNEAQLVCKTTSAIAKFAAIGGMACPPVAIAGTVVSAVAEFSSAVVSLDRAQLIEKSIMKAESTLRDDMQTTNQLKNMLSDYDLELRDFQDSIRDLHRASRARMFAGMDMSPNTAKLMAKIESTEVIDNKSTSEIMSCVSEIEWEEQDFFGAVSDLLQYNQGFRDLMKDGAQIFGSVLTLALVIKNGAISSWFAVGFNAISLFYDFKQIGELIKAREGDGTDDIVVQLRVKILKRLENERKYLARGVELSKKK